MPQLGISFDTMKRYKNICRVSHKAAHTSQSYSRKEGMERTVASVVSSHRLKDRQVFLTDSDDS